ncbi:MAG: CRTAC1 family protein [Gammaproteobacteria bacterium]|nr:CRTAC1 family protein [Gammaproteobacteria bacterium]
MALAILLIPVKLFAAPIQFEDVSAQAGFQLITTSYGASWGDINSDGWPDLFSNNHARRNSIYLNDKNGAFTDVILQVDGAGFWSGAGAWEDTHGGSWADFDNDGDQDLLISTGNCCDPQFFENENGILFYRSIEMGFGNDADAGGRMPVWFDTDDDGLLETAIMSFYPAPLMKQASGSFYKLPWSTLQCKENQFANLIDLDADGHLDIICVHKGGPFAQVAYDISTSPLQKVTSSLPSISNVNEIITADFDGNLRTDMVLLRGALRPSEVKVFDGNSIEAMFVSKDRSFSFQSAGVLSVNIDWNKTFNQFTNIWIGENGGHPASETFTLDPADPSVAGVRAYQPKSYAEIYIGYDQSTQTWHFNAYSAQWMTAYFEIESTSSVSNLITQGLTSMDKPVQPVLLSNTSTGLQDITNGSGLDEKISCVGGTAGDFDNDMDVDMYLVCRGGVQNIQNRMYVNDGLGNFTLAPNEGGANSVTGIAVTHQNGTGEGVVSADYDVDGLLDLFVTNGLNMWPHFRNGGPDQMFHNIGDPRQWVELDLVGTISNRDAIGAKVYATAGGKTQLREQDGGYHRWAQDHQRIHFGLADNTLVDLEIQWPSGITEYHNNVIAGSLYRVTENEGIEEIILDGGGGQLGDECHQPSYSAGSEKAVFVWKDCNGLGNWHMRATAGGSTSIVAYAGNVTSDLGFTNLTPFSFEGADVLDTTDPTKASYLLQMLRAGQDGFDFTLPPGTDACFDLTTMPPGTKLLLGTGKVETSVPFNMTTLEACASTPPPPPSGDCGAPAINSSVDGGVFLWKDCDADRWHVKALSAGGYVSYTGSLDASEPFQDLSPDSLESADIFSNSPSNRIDFTLRLANPWYDGFEFTMPCSATISFSLNAPTGASVFVGAGQVPAPSAFNLSDLPMCNP